MLQDRIQHITLHSVILSPRAPLGWDSFSDCPCFWWPWHFRGRLIRYMEECPLMGLCITFFSWLDWGYGFCGRRSQWSRAIFITLYHGHILSTWLTTVDVDLDHPTEVVFVRFLHHKCSCTPIFYTILFCLLFHILWSFLLSMNISVITLIIREKKIYVCFGKKNDKVSSNFHPFSIYCYGLIFTLLLMAPPEDPVGSSLVTASVPPEYDPDLDPGWSPHGECFVQCDFWWCHVSSPVNQPGTLPSL